MNIRRSSAIALVILALALSFIHPTIPQTQDVPLIIYPGLDGIATVTPEYNVFISPPCVVDANTAFTNVVRLYCPGGYTDVIGIANLTLNPNQIEELQIFVTYFGRKVILCHYRHGAVVQSNTFTLYSETEAIMGISTVPTVTKAGPIDPIYYNITCSYGLRNIAITAVGLSATEIYTGQTLNIEVSVKNKGTGPEDFHVTTFWDDPAVGVQDVTGLAAEAETTLTFSWTVTGVPHGNYTIKAVASEVPGECDLADNTYIAGNVTVKVLGDVNDDGNVKFDDLFSLAAAYGSKAGDPNWNPNCDFDGDGRISFADLFSLASNYGYVEKFTIDHPVTWGGKTYHVVTESNSAVTDFAFSQPSKEISFNVTGPHSTTGYCKVTIPSDLLGPLYTVLIDDVEQAYWFEGDDPSYPIVCFRYSLSTRKVRIIGSTVVGGS